MDTTPSLHDCLSLGEVELGLPLDHFASVAEMERLPTLLRLLALSRPLSSVPTFDFQTDNDEETGEEGARSSESADHVIDEAVRRLEDLAAMYSIAEGVEVVSCHLAPAVCRRISRARPLKKDSSGKYGNVQQLFLAAASPLQGGSHHSVAKRRRMSSTQGPSAARQEDDLRALSDEDDVLSDDERAEPVDSSLSLKRHRASSIEVGSSSVQISVERASEDTQEATVSRTLMELTSLVIQSLKPPREDEGDRQETSIDWSLTIEDSILAEARHGSKAVDGVGGTMVSSDLGSTVASLMYHAHVLRHEHVAATHLIARMGANCPAAVPCLVRGCVRAYERASQSQAKNLSIALVARNSIKALAELSAREKCRIRTMLRQDNVMVDVQLELAIGGDPLAATCMLIEHLSRRAYLSCDAIAGLVPAEHRGALSRRNSTGNSESGGKTRSLTLHLIDNPDLLMQTLAFLVQEMTAILSSPEPVWGRINLILTAHIWLFSRIPVDKLARRESGDSRILDLVQDGLRGLIEFAMRSAFPVTSDVRVSNPLDRPYSLVLCASLVTAVAVAIEGGGKNADSWEALLSSALEIPRVSLLSESFRLRLVYSTTYPNAKLLTCLVQDVVFNHCTPVVSTLLMSDTILATNMESFCERLSTRVQGASRAGGQDVAESFIVDQRAMLAFVQNESIPAVERTDRSRQLLELIFFEAEAAPSFLQSQHCPAFIQVATTLITQSHNDGIPMVLPVDMEKLSCTLMWKDVGQKESQFLLQLLYTLLFLDLEPDSPFKADIRLFPLTQVYAICRVGPRVGSMSPAYSSLVVDLIRRHSPEIPGRAVWFNMVARARYVVTPGDAAWSQQAAKGLLLHVLRKSIADPSSDPSGLEAERAFLSALFRLSENDLFSTAVSALTSKPESPTRYYTYSALYRDPLIVMKSPVNAWNRPGWQRVIVTILSSLLETNDIVVGRISPSDETRAEFSSSRDMLVVRCLLNGSSARLSGMCCGLVRKIVSEHHKIVQVLLKQGIDEDSLDRFIYSVPETFSKSKALSQVFSDRNSLTAAERLVAAEGVLRIAVVHCNRRCEDAQVIAYSALMQLIASFFLVVGPVGVPVSALALGDGTKLDATQLSRKAAFRMLRTLQNVKGYRPRLRNECRLVMQKLAGLCKGEAIVGGITGSASLSRQKNFIRDLMDAVVKAANAMGTSIQL